MGLADALGGGRLGSTPLLKTKPEVLLAANTVPPMHGVVPRIILGREWWDKTRHEAYAATQFRCAACGVHKYQAKEHQWLEGHEVYTRDYPRGRQTYVETVGLCHYCHCYIHDGRLKSLLEKGEVTPAKFAAVMKHGDAVLAAAKLKKNPPYVKEIAKWADWRLVLFGKEYPPVYATYATWVAAFWATDESCPENHRDHLWGD